MKELKIKALVENLEQVLAFLDAELEEMDCDIKIQMQMDIAVEEMFVNIASYAYENGTGDATIQISGYDNPDRVELTFIDNGIPYDPLAKEDPDITLSAEEREIGGLGIFMVKKSMDDMIYERQGDKNVLKIVKNL